MKELMKGIDVSHWQGNFNFWDARVNHGIEFAVIKAGGSGVNGCYKDDRFDQFYADAKAEGLNLGAYWYTTAQTVEDARYEARWIHNYCLKGKQFDMPIYLDVEDPKVLVLGKRKLTDIVKAFLDTLGKLGYFVGIYSSLSYFSSYLIDSELTGYTHWVAQWGAKACTYQPESCLGMWQKTGGTGALVYMNGQVVDTDVSYVDFPAKIKAAGLNGYPSHTHEWEYISDPVNHCKRCKACGVTKDTEKHNFVLKHDQTHHFRHCTVCGVNTDWDRHTIKVVGAKEATTASDGYTGDKVCADCGTTVEYGKVIPKIVPPKEDVNGDGAINAKDLTAEMKAVSQGTRNIKYDVNGDGDINSKDVTRLMKKISKG